MIVNIHITPELEPDVVHTDVWTMKVITSDGEVKLSISEEDGMLHLSVDSQIIIEPKASNTFNVYSRKFARKKEK
jgi:hypothetical protein